MGALEDVVEILGGALHLIMEQKKCLNLFSH